MFFFRDQVSFRNFFSRLKHQTAADGRKVSRVAASQLFPLNFSRHKFPLFLAGCNFLRLFRCGGGESQKEPVKMEIWESFAGAAESRNEMREKVFFCWRAKEKPLEIWEKLWNPMKTPKKEHEHNGTSQIWIFIMKKHFKLLSFAWSEPRIKLSRGH